MKKISLCILIFMFLLNLVNAEKLCLKKVQRVTNKNTVKLSRILRTQNDCPRRYIEVLDTSAFKGDKGDSGVISYKAYGISARSVDTSTELFNEHEEIGTFTKTSATSYLKISMNANILLKNDVSSFYLCKFQPRVNNLTSLGSSSLNDDEPARGVISLANAFGTSNAYYNSAGSTTAFFKDLPAGEHTIQIFSRIKDLSSCTINSSGVDGTLYVEEIEP